MITVSHSEGGPDPNGVNPPAADEPRELNFSSLGKGLPDRPAFIERDEAKFAPDSALEGNGFELPVPSAMQGRPKAIIAGFGCKPPSLDYLRLPSNPFPSSGESCKPSVPSKSTPFVHQLLGLTTERRAAIMTVPAGEGRP